MKTKIDIRTKENLDMYEIITKDSLECNEQLTKQQE